jgi:hypothetical protein
VLGRVVRGLHHERERLLLERERRRLLSMVAKGGVCAEIGVWRGDFSARILEAVRPRKLHLIDPWRYAPEYEHSYYGRPGQDQATLDVVYDEVVARFSPEIADGVVEIHRQTSEEAAATFADGYFDFVYVDGNHLYGFVRRDLGLYLSKLRRDAILAGDDYGLRGWWDWGVKRAVDDELKAGTYEPVALGRQFVLRPRHVAEA